MLPGELHPFKRALMGKPLQEICVVTRLRVALAKQAAPAHRQARPACCPPPTGTAGLQNTSVQLFWIQVGVSQKLRGTTSTAQLCSPHPACWNEDSS